MCATTADATVVMGREGATEEPTRIVLLSTLVSALFGRSVVGGALLLTPPSWTLGWSAPDGCPAQAEVEAALGDALGPAAETAGTLVIDGRVRRRGAEELRLDITFSGALAGERTLTGRDCDELTDAAVLVIAIVVNREDTQDTQDTQDEKLGGEEPQADDRDLGLGSDDHSESAPGPAKASSDGARRAAPEPTPSDLPEPLPAVRKLRTGRSRAEGFVRAGAGASGGHLPALAAVFGIEAGITGRAWRTSLAFSGSLPREVRSTTNPAVGAAVSLWSLSPGACHLPRAGEFAFPLCLGVELGAMRARGTGALVRSETASSLWSAGRISAGLLWHRNSFGLWLALSGTVAFARPAFRTLQTPLVFRAGGFGAHLVAGVELRLPRRSRG